MLDIWTSNTEPWISSDEIWLPAEVIVDLDCLTISSSVLDSSIFRSCVWEAPVMGASFVIQESSIQVDCSVNIDILTVSSSLLSSEVISSPEVGLDTIQSDFSIQEHSIQVDCIVNIEVLTIGFELKPAIQVYSETWFSGASSDDGYVYGSTIKTSYQYLYFGRASTDQYSAFLRFPSISLPSGITIQSAVCRWQARNTKSDANTNVKIHCEDADSAEAPTTAAAFNSLLLTEGTVWNGVPNYTASQWYDSIDFAKEVQAIIDRDGWEENNALMIVIKDNSGESSLNYREIYSYEQGGGNIPQLIIEWSTIPTGDRIVNLDSVSLQAGIQEPSIQVDCTVDIAVLTIDSGTQEPSIQVDCTVDIDVLIGNNVLLEPSIQVDCTVDIDVLTVNLGIQEAFADCSISVNLPSLHIGFAPLEPSFSIDVIEMLDQLNLTVQQMTPIVHIVNFYDKEIELPVLSLNTGIFDFILVTTEIREWIYFDMPVNQIQTISSNFTFSQEKSMLVSLQQNISSTLDIEEK